MSENDTDSVGMDGNDMKNFFRTQMIGILKPFAQNVEELHTTVLKLSSHMKAIEDKIQPHTVLHQQHGERLDGLQGKYDYLIQQDESTRNVLYGWIEESKRIQLANSQRMEKLENAMSQLQLATTELQKSGEDTCTQLAACQDDMKKMRSDNVQFRGEVSDMSANLHRMDQGRLTSIIETVRRHKVVLDINTKEQELLSHGHKQLTQEQKEHRAMCEDRLKELDEQNKESQRQLLQCREESQQALDAKAQQLWGRLDAHDVSREEALARFNKIDEDLVNQTARIVENSEQFNKLLSEQDQRLSADIQVVRHDFGEISTLTSKHTTEVAELQTATGVLPGRAQNRIDLLEEEAVLSEKRNLRLENVLQLEPMTKENADTTKRVTLMHGVMLSDEQLQQFKDAFAKYDSDNSGSVDSHEVGEILRSLGMEVDPSVVDLVLNEIDQDQSGEISFDEFCSMMSKMLDAEGNVDADGYMKNLSKVATREARQNEIVELFPVMQQEVKNHQNLIQNEIAKINTTNNQLQDLEKKHMALLKQVELLKMGQEMQNEHWLGMSAGLKQTKQAVHKRGSDGMLPNAMVLRKAALPPLDGDRPGSSFGKSAPNVNEMSITSRKASAPKGASKKDNMPSFSSLFAQT